MQSMSTFLAPWGKQQNADNRVIILPTYYIGTDTQGIMNNSDSDVQIGFIQTISKELA